MRKLFRPGRTTRKTGPCSKWPSMTRIATVILLARMSAACTSVRVTNVDPTRHPMPHVCIVENPKSPSMAFSVSCSRNSSGTGFGPARIRIDGARECEYRIQYSARRGWDMVTYLKFAELRITRNGELVGAATYRHAGGFGLNKYASTETKMRRLIDRLLVGFPGSAPG